MASDRVSQLINKLDMDKFSKFLERVILKLPLPTVDIFSIDEREKLISIFVLQSQSDLNLILDWSTKTFGQAGFEQCNLESLREKLQKEKIDLDHIEIIGKIWLSHGKSLIDRLKSKTLSSNQLIDINFVLNVDTASASKSQLNQPSACLQLITESVGGKTEKLNLELDHSQLLNLYDKLEEVQKQLDSLTG